MELQQKINGQHAVGTSFYAASLTVA